MVIDEQRRDGHDQLGTLGDRGGGVGARPQPAGRYELRQGGYEPLLTRERLLRGVDELDNARIDVAADDLVAGQRDLGGERQSDLAERDDDGRIIRLFSGTVWPLRALSSTASATSTISTPCSSVTALGIHGPLKQIEEGFVFHAERLFARSA